MPISTDKNPSPSDQALALARRIEKRAMNLLDTTAKKGGGFPVALTSEVLHNTVTDAAKIRELLR
jgi:hypothetical protein